MHKPKALILIFGKRVHGHVPDVSLELKRIIAIRDRVGERQLVLSHFPISLHLNNDGRFRYGDSAAGAYGRGWSVEFAYRAAQTDNEWFATVTTPVHLVKKRHFGLSAPTQ